MGRITDDICIQQQQQQTWQTHQGMAMQGRGLLGRLARLPHSAGPTFHGVATCCVGRGQKPLQGQSRRHHTHRWRRRCPVASPRGPRSIYRPPAPWGQSMGIWSGKQLACGEEKAVTPEIPELPTEPSPFAVFGIEPAFVLDLTALRQQYHKLQMVFHPDRFASAEPEVAAAASKYAAVVNDAYNVLVKPCQRAQFLLVTEHGINAIGEGANTAVDPELLMEMLEARETVAESDDTDELASIQAQASAAIERVEGQVAEAFAMGDAQVAAGHTVRLQYYVKLLEVARDKLSMVTNRQHAAALEAGAGSSTSAEEGHPQDGTTAASGGSEVRERGGGGQAAATAGGSRER